MIKNVDGILVSDTDITTHLKTQPDATLSVETLAREILAQHGQRVCRVTGKWTNDDPPCYEVKAESQNGKAFQNMIEAVKTICNRLEAEGVIRITRSEAGFEKVHLI